MYALRSCVHLRQPLYQARSFLGLSVRNTPSNRITSTHQWGSGAFQVAPVSLPNFLQRFLQIDGVAFLLVLSPAPLRAHFGRSSKENFQLRVRENYASDVAPFHHHAALLTCAPLLGHKYLSNSGIHRNF